MQLEEEKLYFQNSKIIFTEHATDRIKERFGLKKSSVKKITEEAVKLGTFYKSTATKTNKNPSACFIYKDRVFVFAKEEKKNTITLTTAFYHNKNTQVEEKYHFYNNGKKEINKINDKKRTKTKIADANRKSNKYKNYKFS